MEVEEVVVVVEEEEEEGRGEGGRRKEGVLSYVDLPLQTSLPTPLPEFFPAMYTSICIPSLRRGLDLAHQWSA